jgi:alpha-D-xyloside xylohydrolase
MKLKLSYLLLLLSQALPAQQKTRLTVAASQKTVAAAQDSRPDSPMTWTEVAPGVWKGIAGTPESYDLLKASGAVTNKDALTKMAAVNFPLSQNDITATISDGKTYLRFPLESEEQLYGFGLNFQTVHQRGKILQLHMDHYGGRDNGRTHAPVPFYVSSKGYGVFINSARYIDVYAGTGVRKDSKNLPPEKDRNTDKNWSSRPYSDAVEILVPAEGAEVYVFAGPTSLDAVRRFNLFNGGGPLPPRWGLGFTQRVRSLFTADSVKKEAEAFLQKGYPLDFIGLEPGWQSKAYPGTFEWDRTRYPEPEKFVKEMLDKNIRLNLWINPYVSKQASFYKDISPYTGSHTVWVGEVPDFTMPEARKIFFGQLKKDQVDIGVSGYKIDEVDGYDHYLWPDVATFPSGTSAEQLRQTYGLLAMRYTAELFHQKNQRTYGLVRANNGGGVSLPFVIYNDYYNHEDFITALINSGYIGVLWTPEARASKTAEEWLRRFQTVIFSPMAMINAWASGTKPWSYPEVAEQIKQLALLRMQMMPYWYSEFAKYHFEGTPVFRGMSLEDGFRQESKKETGATNLEENPYAEATAKEIKDQYMAGEYLLVAPLFTGQTTRKVILPKGKWYDFYTGEYAGDGEVLTVTPGLDKIPVYVKDGGIIPMMPPMLHAPKTGEKVDIEIRQYGEKPGKYLLYDDDGETFDYEKGLFSWRTITVEKDKKGVWKGTISAPEKDKPNTIGNVTWKFMSVPAKPLPSLFKKKAIKTLRQHVLAEAALALKEQPVTVTAQVSPRSAGSKHDFFSEGDYWWPNPVSADSPYVQKDGMTNPDNFVAHRHAMIRFSRIVGALASAYTITTDDKYVRYALLHCKAWFVDTATKMNPNMLYAQAIKGRFTGRGIGIIDAIQLMDVTQGLRAMENSPAMDKVLLSEIKNWFDQFLQWLTTHQYGKDEMNAANNHGTCWVMQVAAFAKFTRNRSLIDFCRDRYKKVLLLNQVAADGSFPQELRRTKPYGYSIFNLDAMATICQLLSSDKDNLWTWQTPDGRSIKKAIEYLYPFIADKTKWPHKQDVMYWENWPVAQPFLLFGADAFNNNQWFDTWSKLDHSPKEDEVIRNLPVRHPLIWINNQQE